MFVKINQVGKNPSRKYNKEEVLSRSSTRRQVLEFSNKENSLLVLHTHRENSSNFSNEAILQQTAASTIKSKTNIKRSSRPRGPSRERLNKGQLEESQLDILKKILGRLTAIEEKPTGGLVFNKRTLKSTTRIQNRN
ncbi:20547_t:CDS:2 [Gigaspora rosea]|nr:20547_t:CDS:2 [Gigaspora rosea]